MKKNKYFNPKYPNASPYWTRKWDRKWLLNKDFYLLNHISEKSRKTTYRYEIYIRIIIAIATFGALAYLDNSKLINISALFKYNHSSGSLLFIIIFLIILIRFTWVFYLILTIVLFTIFPIKGLYSTSFNFSYTIESCLYIIFCLFLLAQGISYYIYFFNKLYLRKFDDYFIKNIAPEYNSKEMSEELNKAFKVKFSDNRILYFLFSSFCLYSYDLPVSMAKAHDAPTHSIGFHRLCYFYSWAYYLKPEWFYNMPKCNKPIKVFCYISFITTPFIDAIIIIIGIISIGLLIYRGIRVF
ncbi:hypothetical protein ACFPDQ_02855 [Pseudofrancisella aestuarii]|uniref:Uncharacterized protein n=1 Tax=Pseudofrancisella aestuarii TaxID=2670347 RepID=A0ABV9TAZ8_9GAMM|nr:hypothetical protein [Pseudofrancisella aestuarii]